MYSPASFMQMQICVEHGSKHKILSAAERILYLMSWFCLLSNYKFLCVNGAIDIQFCKVDTCCQIATAQ
jgi:hypothetical protein